MSEKTSLQSVSESYRSRGGAFVEDIEDGVDTNQVQAQNASEHAGGFGSEAEPPHAPPADETGDSAAPDPESDELTFPGNDV